MKAHEIADYLKPEQISVDALCDLENALSRQGPGLTTDEIQAMYGDEERDLRIQQQRLDAAQTRVEIETLDATAALDRAKLKSSRLSVNLKPSVPSAIAILLRIAD